MASPTSTGKGMRTDLPPLPRMAMGYSPSLGMHGSGAATGSITTITLPRHAQILWVHLKVLRECSKAVPISATNPIATGIEWPLGRPTLRIAPQATSAFVVCAISRKSTTFAYECFLGFLNPSFRYRSAQAETRAGLSLFDELWRRVPTSK